MATKKRRVRARPTPSGKVLDELLDEDGPEARAIRSEIDRSMLWRYCKGKSSPNADTIATLTRLSGGRIPANGWAYPPPSRDVGHLATGTDG